MRRGRMRRAVNVRSAEHEHSACDDEEACTAFGAPTAMRTKATAIEARTIALASMTVRPPLCGYLDNATKRSALATPIAAAAISQPITWTA